MEITSVPNGIFSPKLALSQWTTCFQINQANVPNRVFTDTDKQGLFNNNKTDKNKTKNFKQLPNKAQRASKYKKQKLNSWTRLTLSFHIGEQDRSQSGSMSGASNWLLTCREAISVVLWNPRQAPKMLIEK